MAVTVEAGGTELLSGVLRSNQPQEVQFELRDAGGRARYRVEIESERTVKDPFEDPLDPNHDDSYRRVECTVTDLDDGTPLFGIRTDGGWGTYSGDVYAGGEQVAVVKPHRLLGHLVTGWGLLPEGLSLYRWDGEAVGDRVAALDGSFGRGTETIELLDVGGGIDRELAVLALALGTVVHRSSATANYG